VSTTYADYRFIDTKPGAQIVNAVLALTILASPVVLFEPSPYEGMVLALAMVAFGLGLPIQRGIKTLLILLMVWAVGGLFALLPVFNDGIAVKYYAISIYLMTSTVLFTCLFAEDTIGRVATLANAYIIAAVAASLIAIAAYFGLIPGADILMQGGRAKGTFKDANVFAPYLVFPTLVLVQRVFERGIRISYVLALPVLLFALFIAFSRGAWGNFVLSVMVMVGLMVFVSRPGRFRRRMIAVAGAGAALSAMLFAASLAIPSVHHMFTVRAELVQSYDVGSLDSRFGRQQQAVGIAVEKPNGLGPKQFARRYMEDIHNVYLTALISYGWLGGLAYIAVVLVTLAKGLQALLTASPWRSYLVAAYAAFVGVAAEGMVIDTDHWRHFYLLIGLIWGLAIATSNYRRQVPLQALQATEVAGARTHPAG
jgi:O-antigen ligase